MCKKVLIWSVWIIFVEFVIGVSSNNETITCLSCTESQSLADCRTISRCASDEKCFADAYNSSGRIVHTMGCRKTDKCNVITGPDSHGDKEVCSDCCVGDLCNSKLCGQTGIVDKPSRGPICFQCDQQKATNSCRVIHVCGRSEVCFMTYKVHSSLYETKCIEKMECDTAVSIYDRILVGRKKKRAAYNDGNRCVLKCCDTDLCNGNCHMNETAQTHHVTATSPLTKVATTLSPLITVATTVPDACSSSPCVQGSCQPYSGTYMCKCPEGFTGRNCQINNQPVDPCVSNPCQFGTCLNGPSGYICQCVPGFTGMNCNSVVPTAPITSTVQTFTPTDYCSPSPCKLGTCINRPTGFTCDCYQGFYGPTCSQTIIDPCTYNPCLHGGTCHSASGNYSCDCPAGFAGIDCGQISTVDPCTSSPCNHGVCVTMGTGYTCTCNPGYEGQLCDKNYCSPSPCKLGTCINRPTGFTCDCYQGFYGPTCSQTIIDPCTYNPCLHGGTCHSASGNYSCDCPAGFAGIDCGQISTVDPCTSSPCNHGVCVTMGTGYTCTCNPGYEGQLCDKTVVTCSLTCKNGQCQPTHIPGALRCVCDSGFTGLNCDTPITPSLCMPNPCIHGGMCTVTDNGYAYQCACMSGHRGQNCQYPSVGCSMTKDCAVAAFSTCPDGDFFCASGTCECLE